MTEREKFLFDALCQIRAEVAALSEQSDGREPTDLEGKIFAMATVAVRGVTHLPPTQLAH